MNIMAHSSVFACNCLIPPNCALQFMHSLWTNRCVDCHSCFSHGINSQMFTLHETVSIDALHMHRQTCGGIHKTKTTANPIKEREMKRTQKRKRNMNGYRMPMWIKLYLLFSILRNRIERKRWVASPIIHIFDLHMSIVWHSWLKSSCALNGYLYSTRKACAHAARPAFLYGSCSQQPNKQHGWISIVCDRGACGGPAHEQRFISEWFSACLYYIWTYFSIVDNWMLNHTYLLFFYHSHILSRSISIRLLDANEYEHQYYIHL